MQFPVPQFTDVEDKIIAGLSFKQFAIVFAAGILTFVSFTISGSVPVTVAVGIFTGLPALALVFGKLNGRPLYASAGNFVRFMFGPKVYVYHKEGKQLIENNEDFEIKEAHAPVDHQAATVKIKQLNYLLEQQTSKEQDLLTRIEQKKKQK